MTDRDTTRILSRLPDDQFVDCEIEVAKICALAQTNREYQTPGVGCNPLLLGAPRVGKSEIL